VVNSIGRRRFRFISRPVGHGAPGKAVEGSRVTATEGAFGDTPAETGAAGSAFTIAGGEMATLIESTNWAASELGPRETWPQSLLTILRIMVTSRYAMWMAWGNDLRFFYNDAYSPTLGVKHPWALGRPADEVWREIWGDIGPRVASVMRTGQATWDEALLLFLERSGYPEETYHTFSYSPLPDDTGKIMGMLCVVMEETERVIGERRVSTLRDLGSQLAAVRAEPDVSEAITHALGYNGRDLPFSILYQVDAETGGLRRMSETGGVDQELAPLVVARAADLPWPVADVLAGRATRLIHAVDEVPGLPGGAWDKPPRRVVIVPIPSQGQREPAGVLIAGLNPYRPFGEAYAGFIDLVAAQIASGLAAAGVYEAERRRAEALAEIDRAKTAFFSNVSHEFRTPLTLMLGPLEEEIARLSRDPADGNLAAGNPTAGTPVVASPRVGNRPVGALKAGDAAGADASRRDAAGRLLMAHRNGLRLLRLVNTLLDFSRIEAGRVEANFEPIDLAGYTAELTSNFRSACERAGLRLVVRCPPLRRAVYIDADMWERIVLNLVSNAFKYTLAGEITVVVQESADQDAAVLSVGDTGVGIPPAELPHIFDRFHRIEGQRGRTLEGTGIGLALVNELVRLHGGSIQVTSSIDAGTTMSVRIPFGRAHLPADRVSEASGVSGPDSAASAAFVEEALRWLPDEQDAPSAGAPILESSRLLSSLDNESPPAGHERRRILLADDNADMRDYVTRLLRPGYEIATARDGQEALRLARTMRPDLILSDVMMPRMDGFGLLGEIRCDATLRDLPVILISARAGEEARLEGLDAGADDYLVKPFSARELLARVRSNLELARLRQEARDVLREANELLEQRVAAEVARRTEAEESLRQSQKMEAIGHLTGGVAHDFNNLLTVIGGGVETLQRLLGPLSLGTEEIKINRALSMIGRSAERAATLTHRLLAFARRQTLDPQPVDANKLVAGTSELLRRTLGESIALETVLAGGLWRTMVDANQLENALLNLAVNARDAMPQGGRLTVETANTYLDDAYAAQHEDVTPGQYVMIAVSDTGIGMDRETLDRVFEPFFTTKDVGHGTGLGLSQVYGFIKQSQGHVKLYSEPGQGTVAKLYLPRLLGETAEVEMEAAQPAIPAGRGELILVVEDEATVREHSVASLRELGYRVMAAGDGRSALRLLEREPAIRMLFTDVGLPGGMSGRQLADAARIRRPDLKVLYTTGYARNAIVHGGVLDPGTLLLPKPFSHAALAAKVRAVLDG
jgi:signal transduction histidine kinase